MMTNDTRPFPPDSQLPPEWATWLDDQPETGMGYCVVAVTLADGRTIQDVAVGAGHVLEVRDCETIPFDPRAVVGMSVTHGRWQFRRDF